MISIRSALIKNAAIRGGGGGGFCMTGESSVRYQSSPSSPAYRRYLKKQQQQQLDAMTTSSTPRIPTHKHERQIPSLAVAQSLANGVSEMENEPLLIIAELGNHKARCEILKRHIMMVDEVQYDEAEHTLQTIHEKNRQNVVWAVLPYQVGTALAMVTGLGAIPMVFDIDLALWFNHRYVTMEIPEPSDLDTALETGAWTWNWMEPVLGTASFTLLAFQFSRQQIKNLGMKPYTARLKASRAKALIQAFPRYDPELLHNFVETDKLIEE